MANRFWIGGTGNWNDTANWSTTTGGGGGAAVPTSADDVFIDSASGFGSGGTITLDVAPSIKSITCNSGHTFSLDGNSNFFTVNGGQLVFESGMTLIDGLAPYLINNGSTLNINLAGFNLNGTLTVEGLGTYNLQSNFRCQGFTIRGGTFNTNGYDFRTDEFSLVANENITLNLSDTVITFPDTGSPNYSTNELTNSITINPGTSVFIISGSYGSMSFGNFDYNEIWVNGNPGDVVFLRSDSANIATFRVTGNSYTLAIDEAGTLVADQFILTGTIAGNINIITSADGELEGWINGLTVNNAGTGYSVNDLVFIAGGDGTGSAYVDSVGGSGEVTSLSFASVGNNYVSSTNNATTGGDGTGLTIDITATVLGIHTLTQVAGSVTGTYITVKDETVGGGATFTKGVGFVDAGNVTGWLDAPSGGNGSKNLLLLGVG